MEHFLEIEFNSRFEKSDYFFILGEFLITKVATKGIMYHE